MLRGVDNNHPSDIKSSPFFARKKRTSNFNSAISSAGLGAISYGRFISRLSMYQVPPFEEISLEEFETLALNRLQLLRHLESGLARNLRDSDLTEWIKSVEDKLLPMHTNEHERVFNLEQERRNDSISHFILCLAFCRTDDLRKWFVNLEVQLFKHRFNSETERDKAEFLRTLDLSSNTSTSKRMIREEKEAMKSLLIASTPSVSLINWEDVTYYKVPFEDAADLVGRRSVFVHAGVAYIPSTEILSLVLGNFRRQLEQKLEMCVRSLPKLDEEDRLLPLLKNISLFKNYDPRAGDGTDSNGSLLKQQNLRANQIDQAAKHFPPCMSHLHSKLRSDSHLKHGGRMQYGLFLKAIGLSLEEALTFWRIAFSRKTSDDAFNKNYAYNIRHNYGQEGKRANYTPYSCMKIIMGLSNDNHGCPFKHFGNDSLHSMLVNYRFEENVALSSAQVEEIKGLVQKTHYQLACTRLFELTRKRPSGDTFVSPHQFYEASLQTEEHHSDEEMTAADD